MTNNDLPIGNIVCKVYEEWVLRRIVESWLIPNSKICAEPEFNANYVIYVNHTRWVLTKIKYDHQIKIGYFTHRDGTRGRKKIFDLVANQMDHCIAMCAKTAKHLPSNKTTVIHSTSHSQFRKKKIVLGVCGRAGLRKTTDWIPELQKIDGIEVVYTEGKLKFEQLPDWYKSIDYLVVLSELEGGPMPVLEALSMGKPVIAPDVGWCWEYPVIKYTGLDELISLVKKLIVPDIEYESKQIIDVIKKVCKIGT